MTQEIIRIQQDESDIEFSLEKEQLNKPLLTRAGILDLNLAFNQIPEAVLEKMGNYPHLDGSELYPFIFEFRGEVERALEVDEFHDPNFNYKHFMHPVIEGGLISDIAKTQMFQRIFGIHQLGPNRHYPILNEHNRGEHSIYVAVNTARTFQALYDQDKEGLVAKLKADFAREGVSLGATDEEIIFAALDLAVVTTSLHDLATPAGGDTFKYLANVDEEENLEWMLSEANPELREERNELLDVLKKRDIGEKEIEYIIRCVQGKSETLIDELIHPTSGDKMDHDRIGYTLLDSVAATIFDDEIPERFLPEKISEFDKWKLTNAFVFSLETLGDPEVSAVLGLSRGSEEGIFPVNIIDPSEDYSLDASANLVCTNPEKLAWVVAMRTGNVGLHYAGFKMLGLEYELQKRLEELKENESLSRLLTRESLLSMTDNRLYNELGKVEDEELQRILERRSGVASTTLFRGKLALAETPDDPEAFVSFPIKIKPGLDSPVKVDGETMTLDEYLNAGQILLPGGLIYTTLALMKSARWDIYKGSGS